MANFLVEFDEFGTLATEILQDGRRLRFKVRGSSMRPFILNGDNVDILDVPYNSLKCGDVVMCRVAENRLVIHRIIQASPISVLIQGDALMNPDGCIAPNNVLGRVIGIARQGKQIKIDDLKSKCLFAIWLWLTPYRSILLAAISKVHKIALFLDTLFTKPFGP